MTTSLEIRNEDPAEYRAVEEMTRRAFWNVHVPGCTEHYLLHRMRTHPDYMPELSFVGRIDGVVVGSIHFTKSRVTAKDGTSLRTLTFGPLSVEPHWQRKGIGSALVRHARKKISAAIFPAVLIFGNPSNYVSLGFCSSKRIRVGVHGGVYPTALLALPLDRGPFKGRDWIYAESPAYHVDPAEAAVYDAEFPFMQKDFQPSQEEFFILSQSVIKD